MPFGVDPKTILCAYFKAGFCERGAKCKFSHDKDVERKVEKRNLYEDKRDETGVYLNLVFFSWGFGREAERFVVCCVAVLLDTMETWDEDKLRKVVLSKHGNPRTTTDVCLYLPS